MLIAQYVMAVLGPEYMATKRNANWALPGVTSWELGEKFVLYKDSHVIELPDAVTAIDMIRSEFECHPQYMPVLTYGYNRSHGIVPIGIANDKERVLVVSHQWASPEHGLVISDALNPEGYVLETKLQQIAELVMIRNLSGSFNTQVITNL